MGSTRFRNPPALSSVLAALGTLQLRAVEFLNRVDPLVSASNYYLASFLLKMISRVPVHGDALLENAIRYRDSDFTVAYSE